MQVPFDRPFEYLRTDFRHDVIAGLSIVITGVPQAMAYALIAGLPPIYGLYTAIVSAIVGAAFGSSNHLVTGPTNATCMVILSLTIPYAKMENHLEIVFLLTLMTGIMKLLFGCLRLGGVVRYVSNSVVMGFTTGIGILIAGNQLNQVLGIRLESKSNYLFEMISQVCSQISQTNYHTLLIAIFTAALAVSLRKINRRIPGPLVGVVAMGFFVYIMGWHSKGVRILSDLTPISRGLNLFHVPTFVTHPDLQMIGNLSAGAVALAIFGLIEAATSSRAVAAMSGQRLNFSREFVAQGLANIAGSFFQNFASSASFIRTAECYNSGGRTRVAALMSGLFTALTLVALAPYANYIPIGSLAGVLIVIAYSLVQKKRLLMTWRSGSNSKMVFSVTLASTILFPLQYAIFVGIIMSLVLLLRATGKPDLTLLVPREQGRFEEVPFEKADPAPIVLVNIEGDLYFAAVENLEYELQKVLTPQTRVVVLRMKRLRAVGSTAMAILGHFWSLLDERNISLVVCGIEKDLMELMTASGLRDRIGEPNIFYADNTLFQSTELALARGRGIIDMERQRQEPQLHEAAEKRIIVKDMMSRDCIRFGETHSVREAVWLMSEMNLRRKSADPQPLFIQDRQGNLAGMISPWRLLESMIENLDPREASSLSDAELGKHFCRGFQTVIKDMALVDLPHISEDTTLSEVLKASVKMDIRVLPVCDGNGRVLGLLSQADLLSGLAQVLNVPMVSAPSVAAPPVHTEEEMKREAKAKAKLPVAEFPNGSGTVSPFEEDF